MSVHRCSHMYVCVEISRIGTFLLSTFFVPNDCAVYIQAI